MPAPLDIQVWLHKGHSGFEDDDDDWEAGAVASGFDYDSMKVEPGDNFTIPANLNASVNCDDIPYVLRKTDRFGTRDIRGESDLFLKPGRYRFHANGLIIE